MIVESYRDLKSKFTASELTSEKLCGYARRINYTSLVWLVSGAIILRRQTAAGLESDEARLEETIQFGVSLT